MTSAYQENTGNGHHIPGIEPSDKLSELNKKASDSTSSEQQFRNWRLQLTSCCYGESPKEYSSCQRENF